MTQPFTKMHGLGNDFVVLLALDAPIALDTRLLRQLADRRIGVGCDQVLLVEPGRDGADFTYRVYNADGSEAGHCGNGIRCVAKLLHDRGLVDEPVVRFAVGEQTIETRLLDDGQVRVDMGVPDFRPEALPFTAVDNGPRHELQVNGEQVGFFVVSMGNPHAVIAVEDVASAAVEDIGSALERHSAFPERVNVGFMELRDRANMVLRVWERGAGETLACGTGACAAVAAARQWGQVDDRVEVRLAGGALVIEWAGGDNRLWMTGPAVTVFHGTLAH